MKKIILLFLILFFSFNTFNSIESSSTINLDFNEVFFPLGVYWVQNSTEILKAKTKGFNTVLFGYDLPQAFDLPIQEMLTTCDNEGIKVMFELSYFLRQNATENVTQYLPSLIDHQSIYAWYLIDEPSRYITETEIFGFLSIIREYDNRSSFVQFSTQYMDYPDLYKEIPGNITFLSVDPYPQMPHTNHSIVNTWLNSLNQYNGNESISWVVLKAQEREHIFTMPNYNEFMIDVTTAIQYGVKGINWFTFSDYDSPHYGVSVNEKGWEDIGRVIKQVKPITNMMLSKEFQSPVYKQNNITYAYIENSTHLLIAVTNQNYYWNGSNTIWRNEIEKIEIPKVGEIEFNLIDSFNLTIIEFSIINEINHTFFYPSLMFPILIILKVIRKKKT